MSEVPICQARANVMTYDDTYKKWVPSGSSPGLSKVQIYQHTVNNTFRVVGRKLQDHEVVINCAILKNLKYNQATPTFHQWRDSKHVYGLNFANKEDSEVFANAMLTALDTLNNQGRVMAPPNPPMSHPPMGYQQAPHMGAPQHMMAQHNDPHQQQMQEDVRSSRPDMTHRRHPSGGAPTPYAAPQVPQQQEPVVQQSPVAPQIPIAPVPAAPTPPAAPPAPQPPPAPPGGPPAAPPAPPVPAAPPAPPCPSIGGGGPPPAPPPPPAGGSSPDGSPAPTGLAAALQAAKLKKTVKTEEPSSAAKPPTGGPAIGGGGPADHMNELAKRLAQRANKANAEVSGSKLSDAVDAASTRNISSSPTPSQNRDPVPVAPKTWEKPTNGKLTNGTGSPKLSRRRNPSLTGQEHIGSGPAEASAINSSELEALKQEILSEMRKEMNKMKQEILEAIRDSNR